MGSDFQMDIDVFGIDNLGKAVLMPQHSEANVDGSFTESNPGSGGAVERSIEPKSLPTTGVFNIQITITSKTCKFYSCCTSCGENVNSKLFWSGTSETIKADDKPATINIPLTKVKCICCN